MPRKYAKKKGKKSAPRTQYTSINGPWGTKLQIPIPRIPRAIGSSSNLGPRAAVYPTWNVDHPYTPKLYSVVAGALQAVNGIDANSITNFGLKFGAFSEYAIVGARIEIRVNSVVNGAGLVIAYLDEKSASLPSADQAIAHPHVELDLNNSEAPTVHQILWKANDLLDLDWTQLGTITTPVNLKFWAATASTFTTATTTAQVIVTGAVALAFRGWADPN